MTVTLSYSSFLEHADDVHVFDELQSECIRKRLSLKLSLVGQAAKVTLTKPSQTEGENVTQICGRSPVNLSSLESVGGRLLAPLFCRIDALHLPFSEVLTLRRGKRSVADFFMRNLFYALCRGESTKFDVAIEEVDDGNDRISHEFARRYLWILRAEIDEPTFCQGEFMEKLLIGAYIKTEEFSNPLLMVGADEIRSKQMCATPTRSATDQDVRLLSARASMFPHF